MKSLKWIAKKCAVIFKWLAQFLNNLIKNKEIINKLIDSHYKIKSKKIDAEVIKDISKVLPKLSKDQIREAGPLIEKIVTCLNKDVGDDNYDKNDENEGSRED